ncbi:hypothetical protein B0H17DRAFT_1134759 [Mycena rosella]|uniref:Ubiquitin-like domain-containing protein n=1 Tax=Mycena rosella TaxID=1033263 RepID=A0AAD7DEZ1_MYCRO|nr:hypothetical protein B0H17DRAFT_1134759 [Mycena rosella]
MPLVAAALTFGSFGDILEAARIAKRIIDVLRKGGGSQERLKLILTLQGIYDDMAILPVLIQGHFTTRLRDELVSCRSLLDEFHAKIKSYEGFSGWLRMVVLEEKELASWTAQISERRAALRDLLGPITMFVSVYNCMTSYENWDGLKPSCNMLDPESTTLDPELTTLELESTTLKHRLMTNSLSIEASRVIHQVNTYIQQAHRISPHDISDPVFYVMDPLGRPISIQLSHCDSFNHLDRILRAYLYNRPDAGSTYVERGDYSIVSTEGIIVPRLRLRRELRAGIQFDMSIIKRNPRATPWKCHHCGHINTDAVNGSWVNCRQDLEELPRQESWAESFRLVQIFYVSVRIFDGFINLTDPAAEDHSDPSVFFIQQPTLLSDPFVFFVQQEITAINSDPFVFFIQQAATKMNAINLKTKSDPSVFFIQQATKATHSDPSVFFIQQPASDPSAFFIQQRRQQSEELAANANPEDASDRQSVSQIYEVESDDEVPMGGDDN